MLNVLAKFIASHWARLINLENICMSKSLIFVILLIAAVAGIGYWWYASLLPSGESAPVIIDAELESRLVKYRKLKSIDLDTTPMSEAFFRELVPVPDLLTPLVPVGQNLGRANPFGSIIGGVLVGPTPSPKVAE